jgi:putative PIN family toxin of toxin-antitoxin system
VPAQVLDAWRAHRFQLVTSPAIVEEIRRTMASSRIRRRYHVPDEDIDQLLDLLMRDATVVPGISHISEALLRDPNDEIILSCVADSHADVLVASDLDLLVLGSYRGTPIVTPRQFIDHYLIGRE